MKTLKTLLAGMEEPLQERIEKVLEMMARQAIGSEKFREEVEVWTKSDKSPVTVADLLHQSQIQHLLAEHFPGDAMVCEEPRSLQEEVVQQATEASKKFYDWPMKPEVIELPETGDRVWMLDPIDGTKGYLAGRHYAIALGLFLKGRPLFGAMAVPEGPKCLPLRIKGTLAFGVRGKGAWIARVEPNQEVKFEPLRCDVKPSEAPFRVAVSLEHGGELARKLESRGDVELVKLDSQAKYLAVAAGDLDVYMRESRKDGYSDVTWDHMPGAVIASEAGCAVKEFDGADLAPLPQSKIQYGRGVVCHRGAPGSPLESLVKELTAAE